LIFEVGLITPRNQSRWGWERETRRADRGVSGERGTRWSRPWSRWGEGN